MANAIPVNKQAEPEVKVEKKQQQPQKPPLGTKLPNHDAYRQDS